MGDQGGSNSNCLVIRWLCMMGYRLGLDDCLEIKGVMKGHL